MHKGRMEGRGRDAFTFRLLIPSLLANEGKRRHLKTVAISFFPACSIFARLRSTCILWTLNESKVPWAKSQFLYVDLFQCFPTSLMPRTPCNERYFTAAPIKFKMEISCVLHTYDKNEVINHNFTTLNVSSMTMQYCINGDFRMNMNISLRPNIMNLTLT
jgi:hypothetical protein